jgi:hypothetical protein
MIKNTYSVTATSNPTLLPNASVIDFLKRYSQSIEVLKGTKTKVVLDKN